MTDSCYLCPHAFKPVMIILLGSWFPIAVCVLYCNRLISFHQLFFPPLLYFLRILYIIIMDLLFFVVCFSCCCTNVIFFPLYLSRSVDVIDSRKKLTNFLHLWDSSHTIQFIMYWCVVLFVGFIYNHPLRPAFYLGLHRFFFPSFIIVHQWFYGWMTFFIVFHFLY